MVAFINSNILLGEFVKMILVLKNRLFSLQTIRTYGLLTLLQTYKVVRRVQYGLEIEFPLNLRNIERRNVFAYDIKQ